MDNSIKKNHWENVYETKNPDQVSWTQEVPKTSLDFIASFGLSKKSKIIDIGGGDSKLVDYLLNEGFENITVLDISAKALERAQNRLGDKANKINWIVSDITDFKDKFTDEATVVEAFGLTVHLIPGEENNIKITTPKDIAIAQFLLQ